MTSKNGFKNFFKKILQICLHKFSKHLFFNKFK